MRLVIVSDAWHPQVNGVVRSLERLVDGIVARGHQVELITPDQFLNVPLPLYPEIKLAFTLPRLVGRRIMAFNPDFLHIATEGPLGHMACRYCVQRSIPFTTSYHTRFPEYVAARVPIPEDWVYAFLRRFHNAGCGVMVATDTLEHDLRQRGFQRILRWGRGVDTQLFRPLGSRLSYFGHVYRDLPRPIHLYVGRVAVEKNIAAFLDLNLGGSKVVVGDGPSLSVLRAKYGDVHFLGVKTGEELGHIYASSDVFVFPSKTDTFGMVLLESMASGLPVAAYPVMGPQDVIEHGVTGVLSDDLGAAVHGALALDRAICRMRAECCSWDASVIQFLTNVETAAQGRITQKVLD